MSPLFRFFFASLPASDSVFGQLSKVDFLKALRTVIVATLGYFCMQAAMAIGHLDFGPMNQLVQLIAGSGLMELGRRLLVDKPAV